MNIEVRHLYRTCLEDQPYLKLVKRYASKIKYDILIVFDLRVKDYGQYHFDGQKRLHIIRISPMMCGFSSSETKLDDNAEKYHVISTTIHELYHAQQREEKGQEFWRKSFGCATEVRNPDAADFFSICEVEARTYENKNVLSAVEYYDNACKE